MSTRRNADTARNMAAYRQWMRDLNDEAVRRKLEGWPRTELVDSGALCCWVEHFDAGLSPAQALDAAGKFGATSEPSRMIWMQRLNGGSFDLLDPRPDDVDFREIAWALAHLNRYCGHSAKPVSVALHTMIVCICGEPGDRAHLLLHDAHEAYTGDLTTPVKAALGDFHIPTLKSIERLQARCDAAIYAAAGLAPPAPETRLRIKRADLRALNTERRDFLARPPQSWGRHIESIEAFGDMRALNPLYRAANAGPAHMADLLANAFEQALPALKRAA